MVTKHCSHCRNTSTVLEIYPDKVVSVPYLHVIEGSNIVLDGSLHFPSTLLVVIIIIIAESNAGHFFPSLNAHINRILMGFAILEALTVQSVCA